MSSANGNDRAVYVHGGMVSRRKAVAYAVRDGLEVLNPQGADDEPLHLRDEHGGVYELTHDLWYMKGSHRVPLDTLPMLAELANGNGAPVPAVATNGGRPGRGEVSAAVADDPHAFSGQSEGESLVDAAVELGGLGYRVFPVRPKAKRPYEAGWQENASTDEDRIRSAWLLYPNARIGIAPEGFTVIDVDPRNGGTVPDGLPEDAPRARTAGGGLHVYVAGDVRAKLGAGVDVKRVGGFVVAPPSPGYEWLSGPLPVAELPEAVGLGGVEPPAAEVDQDALRAPSLEELAAVVAQIPNDIEDRDGFVRFLHAIHAAAGGAPEGLGIAREWAGRWTGGEQRPGEVEHVYRSVVAPRIGWEWLQARVRVEPGAVFEAVPEAAGEAGAGELSPGKEWAADFYAFLPAHRYIYVPTGEMWPASSLNALYGKGASKWLDKNRAVNQQTWVPGGPEIIRNKLLVEGGWLDAPDACGYNIYRAPLYLTSEQFGCPTSEPIASLESEARPWLDLVRRVYPEEAEHLIYWLAHRVQHPGEKVNHGPVFGGGSGIGKDTILEPVKFAVAGWNWREIAPEHLFEQFNDYLQTVILRINEAKDQAKEYDRYRFYEHMKTLMAAPPDTLRCNAKHRPQVQIPNVLGVVITTNHKSSLHIPADDRRYYVAWSSAKKTDVGQDYWNHMWKEWFPGGGLLAVARYLHGLDLSCFDPKAAPPKTTAWREMVASNVTIEGSDLADILEEMGRPGAVTVRMVYQHIRCEGARAALEGDERVSRELIERLANPQRFGKWIAHRFTDASYTAVPNPDRADGRWRIKGAPNTVFAPEDLTPDDRTRAVLELAEGEAAD